MSKQVWLRSSRDPGNQRGVMVGSVTCGDSPGADLTRVKISRRVDGQCRTTRTMVVAAALFKNCCVIGVRDASAKLSINVD